MEQHDECAIILVYIFRTPALKADEDELSNDLCHLVFEVFCHLHGHRI